MSDSNSENGSSASGGDAEYRGPVLRTNAQRGGYGGYGGFPYDRSSPDTTTQNRQSLRLYDALNYPRERELGFNTWLSYYYREGPIAGVLDKLVSDTWQGGAPSVTDHTEASGDDEDEQTDFESDVDQLFAHGSDLDLRAPLLDRLIASDLLARLGEFSVLVFGFKDDADVSDPLTEDAVADTGNGNADDTGFGGLAFVEVYSQDDADFETVSDLDDPRHGRPKHYEVGDSSKQVHHSRVVHNSGANTLVDPYRSIPWFKPIVNLIVNIQKILGVSGEGYFRSGYSPIAVSPPPTFKNFSEGPQPNIQKVPGTFGDKKSALAREIESSYQDLERAFFTNGEIQTLHPDVSDPSSHMAEQWAGIAAAKDLPQSILKGNETGERATTEDSASLRRRIAGLRNRYAEPQVFRPVIDLLVDAGVLSGPEGDGYDVEWAPLSEPTDEELATRRKTHAETFAAGAQAFGRPPGTEAEFRKQFLDWSPDVGSEAPDAAAAQDEQFATDARTIMDRLDVDPGSEEATVLTERGAELRSPTATDGGVRAGESRVNADDGEVGDSDEQPGTSEGG